MYGVRNSGECNPFDGCDLARFHVNEPVCPLRRDFALALQAAKVEEGNAKEKKLSKVRAFVPLMTLGAVCACRRLLEMIMKTAPLTSNGGKSKVSSVLHHADGGLPGQVFRGWPEQRPLASSMAWFRLMFTTLYCLHGVEKPTCSSLCNRMAPSPQCRYSLRFGSFRSRCGF